jgi:pimeloyl-ACP methyl ester carboxylesterase
LPGFGNDAVDYTMAGSLVDSLKEQGYSDEQIVVLRVERTDWLQVFWNGALDYKFWLGTADPSRRPFRWYLDRIAEQINELCEKENDKVVLIGHSAGGWLGRAALGYFSTSKKDNGNDNNDTDTDPTLATIDLEKVLGLVSLGSPMLPPPPEVMDMTRGALRITNEEFPGSFHKDDDGLFYITVIGLSVKGEKQERKSPFEPTTVKGFAYSSYEACCGDGTAVGDGVVPYSVAHLTGAIQIDLDGVLHSINAPDRWYGSSQIIDRWHNQVLKEIQSSTKSKPTKAVNTNLMTTFTSAFEGIMFPKTQSSR